MLWYTPVNARRILQIVCHGQERKPLEPLSPAVHLSIAASWLMVSLSMFALAGSCVLAAATWYTASTAVITAGLWLIIVGVILRLVGASVRPLPLQRRGDS